MNYPAEDQPGTGDYRAYPNRATRPPCDMCGLFAGRLMRPICDADGTGLYRCKGCDDE